MSGEGVTRLVTPVDEQRVREIVREILGEFASGLARFHPQEGFVIEEYAKSADLGGEAFRKWYTTDYGRD